MALSDQAKAALLYWGTIQAATSARATTAVLYDALKAASVAEGMGGTVPQLSAVNELRHLATQQRTAAANLARAWETEQRSGLAQGIDSSMIAQDVRTRPLAVEQTMTKYIARFEATFTTPLGATSSKFLSQVFDSGALPASVGDLVAALSVVGQAYEFGAGGSMTDVTLAGITQY